MYRDAPCRHQILAALALSWLQIAMVVSIGLQMPSVVASRSGMTPLETQKSLLRVPASKTGPGPSVLFFVSAPKVGKDQRPGRVRAILDTWGRSEKVSYAARLLALRPDTTSRLN